MDPAASNARNNRKGDPALELVKELRALETSGAALGAFDERRVREVANRINQLDADLASVLANPHVDLNDPYYATLPTYLRKAMLRDKRCLVGYLRWRLDSLAGLWWDSREHLATSTHATAAESEYVQQYNAVMVEYMQSFDAPLDLRAHTSRPPCLPPSNVVEVRGLQPYAYVAPDDRVVQVFPGKLCSVSLEDAEVLVRQGAAEYAPMQ